MRWDSRSSRNRQQQNGGDVVIAVMGMTGAGKSSFIATVTGERSVEVGHNLNSDTEDVRAYSVSHKATKYVLIDTPGFDDSRMSNDEVTQKLTEWLASSYRHGTRLNGIVFIHNISRPRMQGSAYQNMRLFRDLCGNEALANVTLATSFWDQVTPEMGAKRELELKTSTAFWANMLAKGSDVVRLKRDRESCLEILEQIAAKNGISLLVQEEMIAQNRKFQDTTAGKNWESPEIRELEKKMAIEREAEKMRLQKIQEAQQKAQEIELRRLEDKRRQIQEQARRESARIELEYQRQVREDQRQRQQEQLSLQNRLRQIAHEQEQERLRTLSYRSRPPSSYNYLSPPLNNYYYPSSYNNYYPSSYNYYRQPSYNHRTSSCNVM